MALFGKKKEKGVLKQASAHSLPTDQILSMRQQGVPNDRIIDSLQRAGYSSSQIFGAMSQADTMGAAGPVFPPPGVSPEANEFPSPPTGQWQMPGTAQEQPMPPPPEPEPEIDRETIEEVAESIIDEKWEDISKSINKVIEWKNATESKIAALEQQFKDLKDEFENLHTALIGKVNEYDQNILNVGTEIKAMEKVFQKILPTFTENVSELSRITGKLKGKK